jgi:hypothetical protein
MADINLGVGGANSAVAGVYDVANSLKLEPDNTEYLTRTVSTTGNRKTGTISVWLKRAEICESIHQYTGAAKPQYIFEQGNTNNESGRIFARFGGGTSSNGDKIEFQTGSTILRKTTRDFRDTSAWYHFVFVIDTTQATADDRIKIYVNGVQETLFDTSTNFSQNDDTGINFQKQTFGYSHVDSAAPLSGYISEAIMVDGLALEPTAFGQFDSNTGIWVPKNPSGVTFGTNGCYLDFSNSGSLGTDSSGNSNTYTLNNITSADQTTTTPTNTFTTFEDKYHYQNTQVAAEAIVRKGNTHWETTRASWWRTGYSNNGVSNGKWYAEFSANTSTFMVGVGSIDRIDGAVDSGPNTHLGASNTGAIGFYLANGRLFENGTLTIGWGNAANANDIIGIALDMDNGKVYFAINNTWQNSANPAAGTGGVSLTYPDDAYYMGVSFFGSNICLANWGGYTDISIASGNADANDYGNFEYAPPTGYYAWCTKNLAEYG